jgi:N-acetylmuramoyl-L-alanine amidase
MMAVLLAALVMVAPACADSDIGTSLPAGSTIASSAPGSSAATVPATAPATTSPTASGTTRETSPPATVPPSSTPSTTSTDNPLTGKVLVVDPGHQASANPDLEPIGPGSKTMKAKVSSGTSGVATGTPESKLVLTIGLKLREALRSLGATVVMTRITQDVDVSNAERAKIANKAGADLFIRLHANGADDSSTKGLFVLYPAPIKGWTDDIATESKRAAQLALRHLIAATGATDLGIHTRSDLTGFNWSDVPVILAELGHMTNPAEDRRLATASYQDKIVQGLVDAILEYLKTD